MSQTYDYNKTPVDVEKLRLEILADETIVKTLETIVYNVDETPNTLHITFDLALSGGEETALDTLVSNHNGNPPTIYYYFCYCCGLNYSESGLVAPTQCQCCSSTDIQTQYHKCNFIATTDPEVDNDDTEGYCVGSKWINISTGMVFQCVDATTDVAVWKCTTREFDIIENFQQITNYLPETGLAKKIYNGTFMLESGTASKHSASILKMLAIASGAASLIGLHTINPANHTYLEFRWKYKQDTADHLKLTVDVLISDPTQTYFINITTKNSTEIKVDIENGVTADTVDVIHNLTANTEFCVKIKSGEIQFLIDDVLKKSFTGNGLSYDVAAGMGFNYIDISNPDSVSHYYLIDYTKILLGRSF